MWRARMQCWGFLASAQSFIEREVPPLPVPPFFYSPAIHIFHNTFYILHCMYTHCILLSYNPHFLQYILHIALYVYTLHFTLVQSTFFTMHFTFCTVHIHIAFYSPAIHLFYNAFYILHCTYTHCILRSCKLPFFNALVFYDCAKLH